jgi:hypothetical protein
MSRVILVDEPNPKDYHGQGEDAEEQRRVPHNC